MGGTTDPKPEKISGSGIGFDTEKLYLHPLGFKVWLSRPIGLNMNDQTEIEYKGERIVQNEYHNLHENTESFGFKVNRAYVVVDEFDDPSLPTNQQWFWSPLDAMHAIDLVHWAKKFFNFKRWPTTVAHEYNVLLNYKRHIALVYITVREVMELLKSADDGLDDEGDIIKQALNKLYQLHQVVCEGGSRDSNT